jgi:cytochrome P450
MRTPPTPRGHLLFGSGPESMRDPLGFYARAAREHGDVVRFRGVPGMHWHLVSGPAGVEHVLKTRQKNYRKPDRFRAPVGALIGRGLLVDEGESWLRNRRLMQPVFHRARLATFVEQMVDAAEETADRWERHAREGTPVPAASEMMRTTLQIAGSTLFSADVSSEADGVAAAMRVAFEHINRRMSLPLTLPEWVPTLRNRRFHAARRTLDALVYPLIEERRRAPDARQDLLAMLLEAQDADTGERMNDEQVRDETLTLLLAGHETTAACLGWAWHLLRAHPQVFEQLRAELDATLGGRRPEMDDLPRLTYCRAIVEETLRLYPPAWAQPRESIAADEVDGYRIEAGSIVMVAAWVTQRRPDLWTDPDRFDPERFLDGRAAALPPFAYYPFGGGARQCIGSHFAMMEAQIVLATLAQRFDIEPDAAPVDPAATFTLRPRQEIWLRVRRRAQPTSG